ncbi:MAG: efflux RND transporter periplasmic adaptor subunit [Pseudomonadota bacterium]
MKNSVQIAILIAALIAAYFLVRTVTRDNSDDADLASAPISVSDTEQTGEMLEVIYFTSTASPHPIYIDLKGRTAPDRSVTVRSATTGIVTATPADEGSRVTPRSVLCRLDVEARAAQVAEAEAVLASREVDYSAAAELAEKGWSSPNRATSAKASRDAAAAALNAARIELQRTRIAAPFDGIFESRLAEKGDFLAPGGACGTVTDLDPIRIEVRVAEDFAGAVVNGMPADSNVTGFDDMSGTVDYVSRIADEDTRTFLVEIALPNPDMAIAAGLSARVRLQIGDAIAHRVSSALLSLDDSGEIGLRFLDETDTVRFAPIKVVDDAGVAVWVTGLPNEARLLSIGQEYVKAGTRVRAVLADTANAP